jgi:16S rRNA (guanine527-N7)-methyltransferase
VDKPVDEVVSEVQHPASASGKPPGNVAREGSGETRPRTNRVTSDRRPEAQNECRGQLSGGCRAPEEGRLDRRGGLPPTRVSGRLERSAQAPRPALPTDPAQLPPLPSSYADALTAGLAEAGVELGAESRAAIDAHVALLLAWNAAINLTSITDPAAIATRHVVDSLTAVPLIREWSRDAPVRIVDLGSGGGFPGMPLAAALPASHVALVDSVAKKARFLQAAAGASGLGDRVVVLAERAEAVATSAAARAGWDIVTARAVAPLADLVELSLPLLRVGGRLIAWKTEDRVELEAAARAASALGGDAPTLDRVAVQGLEGHVLVAVRKARPTPSGYPRDPATRRRRPW